MNIEFQLISLACHFHNHPFHVHYMPRIIQVCHSQLIHPPTHAYSFPSCHYIIIQSNTRTHSRPALRLGELRLGESLTYRYSGFCAFSLRRDSPRLSETLARSKQSWSPKQPFTWNNLGEPLLISPRQGRLVWARKLVLTTVLSSNNHPHRPKQFKQAFSTAHISTQSIQSSNTRKISRVHEKHNRI